MSCFKKPFSCNSELLQRGLWDVDWGGSGKDIEREAYSGSLLTEPRPLSLGCAHILLEQKRVLLLQEKRRNFENHWWLILSFHKGGN